MKGFTFTSPPSVCPYLPDRIQELRYLEIPALDQPTYALFLQHGWRRFGSSVFRPECPSCAMCQSIRVPVATFRASDSQRRVLRRNDGEVAVRVGEPAFSPEKETLLQRFHQFGHAVKGWPESSARLDFFLQNPFRTEEWTYYLGDRLIAVGYVDALAEGLSAIYFFHDPDEHRRSLGTFNVLKMIEAAGHRGLSHLYLGFYVEGCRSLEYKRRFTPNELLVESGVWSPSVGELPGSTT